MNRSPVLDCAGTRRKTLVDSGVDTYLARRAADRLTHQLTVQLERLGREVTVEAAAA